MPKSGYGARIVIYVGTEVDKTEFDQQVDTVGAALSREGFDMMNPFKLGQVNRSSTIRALVEFAYRLEKSGMLGAVLDSYGDAAAHMVH